MAGHWYIDDNGQIQVSFKQLMTTATTEPADDLRLSLSDADTDVTIPSWIINEIRFGLQGYIIDGETAGSGTVEVCAGVMPKDLAADSVQDLADFQDIKGFPFKRGYRAMLAQNTQASGVVGQSSNNFVRYSYTFRPSRGNKLALNRLQDIVLAWKVTGCDFIMMPSLFIRAYRGS